MTSVFKSYDRDTDYLLPPSITDWLPKNHLAYFVVDIVEKLDLSEIKQRYSLGGAKAYAPEILIGLLFYGYMTGVFSSRKIEAATRESLAFRYIAANQHPDHDTIADFRNRFLPQLEKIFLQILVIAGEMGIRKVGSISLDGTKVKANASKHKALSWGYANKLEEQLKAEIRDLLREAERVNQTDNEDKGVNIPEEITRRENRLKAIDEAKKKIAARAQERYAREKEEYDLKVKKREEIKNSGQSPKGKSPAAPSAEPLDKDQVNLTDEESRIMKVSDGGFEQSYNAQAGVDIDSLLIVAAHVSINTNDKKEIIPAIEELQKLPESVAVVKDLLADTGYHSAANIEACLAEGINPLIAEKREKHHPSPAERFGEPEPLGENATTAERASHRLKTQEGKKLYAKRKSTVEPVFGIIKQVMGFRQFMLRGFEKAKGEWKLMATAWNIKRLHQIAVNGA